MWTNRETIVIPHYLIVLRELAIQPQSMTDIFDNTRITYSHLHKMKGVFLDKGWATGQKEDKKIILTLTLRGYEIVDNFEQLLKLLEISKKDIEKYLDEAKLKHKLRQEKKENEDKGNLPKF